MKGGAGPGGQGGCIEVIVKFEEKSREEVRSGSLVGGAVGWGRGRCEQRIEVIVCENAKKSQDGTLPKRLRTHKVFTKDQCFYLNYHKFSIKSYVLDVYKNRLGEGGGG